MMAAVSRRARDAVIVLFTLAGGGMVAAANFSRSYVPLFFGWLAFAAIPVILESVEWALTTSARRAPGGAVTPA